jgi:hypothetical protein
MQLFLSQLALIKGGENDALLILKQIILQLKTLKALKFGNSVHEIKLKCVFDFSALWKIMKVVSVRVDPEKTNLDKIEYEINKFEGNIKFEERKGCPFCLASRKCEEKCQKKLNIFDSNSHQRCKSCLNRYNNFGVFEFQPNYFKFFCELKNTDFIPCTIHIIKAVTIRMLTPFATICQNVTKKFNFFNDVCDESFGKGVVKAE